MPCISFESIWLDYLDHSFGVYLSDCFFALSEIIQLAEFALLHHSILWRMGLNTSGTGAVGALMLPNMSHSGELYRESYQERACFGD